MNRKDNQRGDPHRRNPPSSSNPRIRRRPDAAASSTSNNSNNNNSNSSTTSKSSSSSYYYPTLLPSIPTFYNPMSSTNHDSHKSNEVSNLVPIWALAAASVSKKQSSFAFGNTASTNTSTTTNINTVGTTKASASSIGPNHSSSMTNNTYYNTNNYSYAPSRLRVGSSDTSSTIITSNKAAVVGSGIYDGTSISAGTSGRPRQSSSAYSSTSSASERNNIQRELYPSLSSSTTSPRHASAIATSAGYTGMNLNTNTTSTPQPSISTNHTSYNLPYGMGSSISSHSGQNILNLNRVLHQEDDYDYYTPHTSIHNNSSGTNTNSGISKSEFSQEKKWIRSGNKWVLTGGTTGTHINSSSTSENVSNDTSHSNSSLWTEMGQSLPTVHSMETLHPIKSNPKPTAAATTTNTTTISPSPPTTTTLKMNHRWKEKPSSPPLSPSSRSSPTTTASSSTILRQNYRRSYGYGHLDLDCTTKIDPTAVSSYGSYHTTNNSNNRPKYTIFSPKYIPTSTTVSAIESNSPKNKTTTYTTPTTTNLNHPNTPPSRKKTSPQSRNDSMLPYNKTTPKATTVGTETVNNHQAPTTTTSSSSVISSSPSLLYTRRRLAITPCGFPYMPSLHLTRSSSSIHKDSNRKGGESAAAATTTNTTTTTAATSIGARNIDVQSNLSQFNHTNNSKIFGMRRRTMSQDDDGEDDEYDDPIHLLLEREMNDGIPLDLRGSKKKPKDKDKSRKPMLSKSPPKLYSSSRAFSDSFRSIDSGYDSETNKRLAEWKKEQYRKSGINLDSLGYNNSTTAGVSNKVQKNDVHSPKDNDSVESKVKASSSPTSPTSKVKLYRNQTDSSIFHFDTGYESGSTTCEQNERLKEWKEQQYKIIRRKQKENGNSNLSSDGGSVFHAGNSNWDLPTARSLDSCDSEDPLTRVERIKEWKTHQFANLPLQQEKSYLGFGDDIDTIKKEDESQGKTTIGFFPITSPSRQILRSSPKGKSKRNLPPKSSTASPPSVGQTDMNESKNTNVISPRKNKTNSSTLPPLTPPRTLNRGKKKKLDEETDKTVNENMKTWNEHSTGKNVSSFDLVKHSDSKHDSSNEVEKTLTSSMLYAPPPDGVMNSSCQVVPKLSSADSIKERSDIDTKKSPILRSIDDWKSVRSQSSFSAITGGGDYESNCSLNTHDKNSLTLFHAKKAQGHFFDQSSDLLYSWENCLYVRAEGARTGRICLSSTHLIFLYDDDIAEAAIFENKWNKKKIDDFLSGEQSSPMRSATPVNVPEDSVDECGVEVIGENELHEIDFLDMLEDGFNDYDICSEEGKGNFSDSALNINEIKCNTHPTPPRSSTFDNKQDDAKMDVVLDSPMGESKQSGLVEKNGTPMEVPQTSVSTSPSYGSTLSDDSMTKDDTAKSTLESPLCEDSYEYLLNECIVRAMKAEAQRRLTEASRDESGNSSTAASYSFWDKIDISRNETANDFGSLLGNQTNVSSFSEPDLEIDPDEERRLYISCSKEPKHRFVGIKWSLSKFSEIYDRRYMTKEVGLEIFCPSPIPATTQSVKKSSSAASVSTAGGLTAEEMDVPLGPLSTESIFLVIPDVDGFEVEQQQKTFPQSDSRGKSKSRRDEFVEMLKNYALNMNDVHWQNAKNLNRMWAGSNVTTINEDSTTLTPKSHLRRRNKKIDALHYLTRAWRKGLISNYDYLLRLNTISGRSYHDPGNYPVMPWVLSNFVSQSVPDLSDERNYRDLTKPMGALCPERLEKFLDKYESLCSTDFAIPPFMYGSHYSNTGGVVLHYLVRKKPFAGLHRQLQGGQFDIPDRLFRSVSRTWEKCSKTSPTNVNELTPEWYSDPSFLRNTHNFNLGTSVDGSTINDVHLPPWAENDSKKFIQVMRNALESDLCSSNLPSWIDLIFGYKQRGPEAEKANNVFYHLSYYDAEDLAKVEDINLRAEIELHIADFGNCPSQLFLKPHPVKKADSLATQSKGELRLMTENLQKESFVATTPTKRILIDANDE